MSTAIHWQAPAERATIALAHIASTMRRRRHSRPSKLRHRSAVDAIERRRLILAKIAFRWRDPQHLDGVG
jgi:hypothetical protein